jgi:hypothetical protein
MSCKNHKASAESAKQTKPRVEAAQRPKPWVRIDKIQALKERHRFLLSLKNPRRPLFNASTSLGFAPQALLLRAFSA